MGRIPFRLPEYVIEWIKDGTHVRVVEPNQSRDIQVKVNDVYTTYGYGVVIIPPGVYTMYKWVSVPSNIALIGCGWSTLLRLADGVASATMHSIIRNSNYGVTDGNENIIIAFLQVDGNKTKQSAFFIGINMKGANDSMIIGCYVHDTYADCMGFWGAPKRCRAIGNLTKDAGPAGTGQNGIFFEGFDGTYGEDCVAADNICIGNGHMGIYFDYIQRGTIVGNVCRGNGDDGIQVYHSLECAISGNVCMNSDRDGIRIRDSDRITSAGNVVKGSAEHGIHCIAAHDSSINGNVCSVNDGDGIYLETSSEEISIVANTCKGNTGNLGANTGIGIHIYGAAACTLTCNVCIENDDRGIWIQNSQHCTIACNICVNNSQGEVNVLQGIHLSDGGSTPYCRYNTVIGNTCYDDQATKTQRYGIEASHSADYNIIVGNNCYINGDATYDIVYSGSNNKVAWNLGRYVGQGSQWDGHPKVTIDTSGQFCAIGLTVPEDYGSLVSAELLFIAHETAASQHLTINTFWGKVGEQRNNHTAVGTDRNLGAVTNGQIHAHDVSDLLSPLEAGDVVGFFIEYSATAVDSNVAILGVRFRYQNKNA